METRETGVNQIILFDILQLQLFFYLLYNNDFIYHLYNLRSETLFQIKNIITLYYKITSV